MSNMQELTQLLDRMNVFYEISDSKDGVKNLCLYDADDYLRQYDENGMFIKKENTYIPYTGYSGFAWLFTFDNDGNIKEVGGYE